MFDWQTEEDESVWEEEVVQHPAKPPVFHRRSWWAVGFVLLLAVVTSYFVYQQVQKQAETAVANVEADIVSSHELISTAARTNDADLMRAMLSGRDMQWAAVQQQLVQDGYLLDRAPLGMMWQPEEQAIVETTIDPALEEAELVSTQTYEVVTASGNRETVVLQQTVVYRRGAQRWLLAPPEDAYWGEWQTLESDRLELIFPGRDKVVAQNLFDDLQAAIDDACRLLPDLECDDSAQIHIRLEKDPASLGNLHQSSQLLRYGVQQLELPAPSLVGLPTDDDSYTALQQGYAQIVVRRVIADAVGWDCCDQGPIFQALVDYQLSQLGLLYWPVSLDDHVSLWQGEQLISLNDLFAYWEAESIVELPPDEVRFLQTAVDFLLTHYPEQSAANLQRTMSAGNRSFLRWIRDWSLADDDPRFVSPSVLINSLDRQWRLYALLQADLPAADLPPLDLPDQDIQMVCMQQDGSNPNTVLVRYDMEEERWFEEALYQDLFFLAFPTARDEALVFMKIPFTGQNAAEVGLWRDGQVQQLLVDGRNIITLGQIDPTGRYLAAYFLPQNNDPNEDFVFHMIDLGNCGESGCAEQETFGSPSWSPSGEQAIFTASDFIAPVIQLADGRMWQLNVMLSPDAYPLYLAAGNGEPISGDAPLQIGVGYAPFWVDETRFGFVEGSDSDTILLGSDPLSMTPILETADLRAALPNDVRLGRLIINYVLPYPQNNDQLIIVASDIDTQGYLFLADLSDGSVEYRYPIGFLINHLLGFSPDGRYLVTNSERADDAFDNFTNNFITIHDMVQNQTTDFLFDGIDSSIGFTFDWSADGKWLLTLLDNGMLQLIMPEENYRQVLTHDFGECQMVAWVNP